MWWFIVPVFLVAFGALCVWVDKDDRRRARLIQKTLTTRIADAKAGERVEIKGRAFPAEEGTIVAPLANVEALYFELSIGEQHIDKGNKEWQSVARIYRSVPFLIDDGSGRRARVVPKGANVMLDRKNVTRTEIAAEDAPPELATILAEERHAKLTVRGKTPIKWEINVIAAGDPIYALGFGELDTHKTVTGGAYRGGLATELVLETGEKDRELLLSTESEEALLSYFRFGSFWSGVALIIAGVSMAIWLMR